MRTSHLFAMGNRAGLVAARSKTSLTATAISTAALAVLVGCGTVTGSGDDGARADAAVVVDAQLDDAQGPDAGPPGACRPAVVWTRGGDGAREIWVSAVDGTEARNLSQSESDDYNPAWSPRGDLIAFESKRGSNPDIFVVPAAGGAATSLTARLDGSLAETQPVWSPDGSLVAFVRLDPREPSATSRLWVVPSDGSAAPRLVADMRAISLSWAPDSRRLVFSGYESATSTRDLWTVDVSAGAAAPQRVVYSAAEYEDNPKWSPNGKWIAFETVGGGNDVWTVGADGSGAVNRTPDTATSRDQNPHWTADSEQLVFRSNREGGTKLFRTAVAAAAGPSVRILDNAFTTATSGDFVASVSPDGERVGFTRSDLVASRKVTTAGVVSLDGLQLATFPPDATDSSAPSWSPCVEMDR